MFHQMVIHWAYERVQPDRSAIQLQTYMIMLPLLSWSASPTAFPQEWHPPEHAGNAGEGEDAGAAAGSCGGDDQARPLLPPPRRLPVRCAVVCVRPGIQL